MFQDHNNMEFCWFSRSLSISYYVGEKQELLGRNWAKQSLVKFALE